MADTPPPPPPAPASESAASKKPIWKRWWFIAGVVVLVIAVIGAAGGSTEDDADTATQAADTSSTEAPEDAAAESETTESDQPSDTEPEAAEAPEDTEAEDEPAASEADDITGCTVIDSQTLDITGTNNSSKQSSYLLSVVFTAGGTRTADEPFFINYVRPGESFVARQFGFSAEGADACDVVEVDRSAAESPGDLSEVTCELMGTDALGDIQGRVIATNTSSSTSDYMIEVALVRDGVRIGTGSAFTENVPPGESAPTDVLTTVDGPADNVTCDVVYVSRTAS